MEPGKSPYSPSGKRTKEEAERLFYEIANPNALPKSLQRNRWSLERLQQRLIEKLELRARTGGKRFHTAFLQFTREPESNGVVYENFHEDLRSKFGFVVTPDESRALYDRCDADGKGYFTYTDFAKALFYKDYTDKLWNARSEDKRKKLDESRRSELIETLKLRTPRGESSNTRPPRPVAVLEEIIQDKILHHTSKQADQFRQAFRLFADERKNHRQGFTQEEFKVNLRKKFGIDITAEEVEALFDKFDADGNGTVDFHEFVTGVLPKDYTTKEWHIVSEERMQEAAKREKERGQTVFVVTEYPKAWEKNKMALGDVEEKMRQKITEHTSRSTDQFRQAFQLFRDGGNSELTKDRLKYQISEKFGIVITDKEVDELFEKYDADGNGQIDFHEFVTGLMPKDYSRKAWSIASEELAAARKEESRKFYKSVTRTLRHDVTPGRTAGSILQLVATKVAQRTPGDASAASAKRMIFRWFSAPTARIRAADSVRITRKAFRTGIENLHFLLSPEETRALEARFAVDGAPDLVDLGKFADDIAVLYEGKPFADSADQMALLYSPAAKNSRGEKPPIAFESSKRKSLTDLLGIEPGAASARTGPPARVTPLRSPIAAARAAPAAPTAPQTATRAPSRSLGSSRSSAALPRIGSQRSRGSAVSRGSGLASSAGLPRVGTAKFTPRSRTPKELARASSRMSRSASTPAL